MEEASVFSEFCVRKWKKRAGACVSSIAAFCSFSDKCLRCGIIAEVFRPTNQWKHTNCGEKMS